MGEEEDDGGHREVVDDWSAIDEAFGEEVEMFLTGDVVEKPDGFGGFSPDDSDESQEVVDDEHADGDDAGDDLAGGEGGCENSDGGVEDAHEEDDEEGTEEGSVGEGGGDVGEGGEELEVDEGGDPEDDVE